MPVDPNNPYADVAHEKTVQRAGWTYGCHTDKVGLGPRGEPSTIQVQEGWTDDGRRGDRSSLRGCAASDVVRREGQGGAARGRQHQAGLRRVGDIPARQGHPVQGREAGARATKWDAAKFARITGWTKRTNEHARDAAGLVFGLK